MREYIKFSFIFFFILLIGVMWTRNPMFDGMSFKQSFDAPMQYANGKIVGVSHHENKTADVVDVKVGNQTIQMITANDVSHKPDDVHLNKPVNVAFKRVDNQNFVYDIKP